jgi:hypothetical protein
MCIINLFGDTHIPRIFYKFSQTYGTEIKINNYLGTEGVHGGD